MWGIIIYEIFHAVTVGAIYLVGFPEYGYLEGWGFSPWFYNSSLWLVFLAGLSAVWLLLRSDWGKIGSLVFFIFGFVGKFHYFQDWYPNLESISSEPVLWKDLVVVAILISAVIYLIRDGVFGLILPSIKKTFSWVRKIFEVEVSGFPLPILLITFVELSAIVSFALHAWGEGIPDGGKMLGALMGSSSLLLQIIGNYFYFAFFGLTFLMTGFWYIFFAMLFIGIISAISIALKFSWGRILSIIYFGLGLIESIMATFNYIQLDYFTASGTLVLLLKIVFCVSAIWYLLRSKKLNEVLK